MKEKRPLEGIARETEQKEWNRDRGRGNKKQKEIR